MNNINVIREAFGIGYISGLRFIDLSTKIEIKPRYYNGRICFQIGKKRIGLNKWKKNSKHCKVELKNDCPF